MQRETDEDPINWPTLFYTCRDPALHELAELTRLARDGLATAAIEWAEYPTEAGRDRILAWAGTLHERHTKLSALGTRLWAERTGRGRVHDRVPPGTLGSE
jgi:hypothetical protein